MVQDHIHFKIDEMKWGKKVINFYAEESKTKHEIQLGIYLEEAGKEYEEEIESSEDILLITSNINEAKDFWNMLQRLHKVLSDTDGIL